MTSPQTPCSRLRGSTAPGHSGTDPRNHVPAGKHDATSAAPPGRRRFARVVGDVRQARRWPRRPRRRPPRVPRTPPAASATASRQASRPRPEARGSVPKAPRKRRARSTLVQRVPQRGPDGVLHNGDVVGAHRRRVSRIGAVDDAAASKRSSSTHRAGRISNHKCGARTITWLYLGAAERHCSCGMYGGTYNCRRARGPTAALREMRQRPTTPRLRRLRRLVVYSTGRSSASDRTPGVESVRAVHMRLPTPPPSDGDGRQNVVAAPAPASIISPNLMEDVGPEPDSAGRHRSASLMSKLQDSSSGSAASRSSSKGPVATRSAESTRRDATAARTRGPRRRRRLRRRATPRHQQPFGRGGAFRQIGRLNAAPPRALASRRHLSRPTPRPRVRARGRGCVAILRLLFVASVGARPAASAKLRCTATRIVRG